MSLGRKVGKQTVMSVTWLFLGALDRLPQEWGELRKELAVLSAEIKTQPWGEHLSGSVS